ncbi:MAG: hypothetical protein WC974_03375 [Thermoplasmata archaeon]
MKYDIHRLKINLKGHARHRFDERFPDMPYEMLMHHFRTGKFIKKPIKDGEVGTVIKRFRYGKICFKFIIQDSEVWIITIGE